jgi:RNA polymerase sigma-70 factor (ECF subfamily)
MSAKLRDSAEEAMQTLGGLLHAGNTNPQVPESHWVDLVRAIAAGDTGAFGTLYMWTHGLVFVLVLQITKSRDLAEQATVDVFQDVWRGAPAFDDAQDTVVAWIMNLARARALRGTRSGDERAD